MSHKNYRLIHDIYVLLDALDQGVLRDFNLTTSQYRILTLLSETQGERLITLSDRMLVARSTITRLIDQMEAAKLVERVIDPEDRRAQRVALTPMGAALHERASLAHAQSLQGRLNSLNEGEQQQLHGLLEKIRLNLHSCLLTMG